MAKMFKHSEDANVHELAIFTTPPTNTSVRNPHYNEHHPVSGITNVIHFSVKGNILKYLDLRKTRLYVKRKIVDRLGNMPPPAVDFENPRKYMNVKNVNNREKQDVDNNENPDGGENYVYNNNNQDSSPEIVFPINHLLHTMWKQVEVFAGGKLISSGSSNYHYKSMLKTLLRDCKDNGDKLKMITELFYPDMAGMHDTIDNISANPGGYERQKNCGYDHVFEMEGYLGEDVFDLDKYIINGVNIDTKLYPERSSFLLMSNAPEKEYKIIIEEAILKVGTFDVGNIIVGAHDHSLAKGGMGQYFFTQSTLNNYSLSKGERNFSQCVFQGNVPERVTVALVSSERYSGLYTLNPLKFHHYNMTSMSVLINDVNTPHRPLITNFRNGHVESALCNILSSSDYVIIDKQAFINGYSLFVFDINPSEDDNELSLQETGTVRLQLAFEEELPESVQVLVYGEFQSCFQIDHS